MPKDKIKILIIVEGKKTYFRLMSRLFDIYGISDKHEIVSYNTNIYNLYNEMFSDNDPQNYDLLQVLKEHEQDTKIRQLFDAKYSDILLIFDLDPQDFKYTPKKIKEMSEYFVESSDMGKLYINYPMVEAFYHMSSIPDETYYERIVTKEELINHQYKERVRRETIGNDYKKFAVTRKEYNTVIRQNMEKAAMIAQNYGPKQYAIPSAKQVLDAQIDKYEAHGYLYVLCTCILYIADYNKNLLMES